MSRQGEAARSVKAADDGVVGWSRRREGHRGAGAAAAAQDGHEGASILPAGRGCLCCEFLEPARRAAILQEAAELRRHRGPRRGRQSTGGDLPAAAGKGGREGQLAPCSGAPAALGTLAVGATTGHVLAGEQAAGVGPRRVGARGHAGRLDPLDDEYRVVLGVGGWLRLVRVRPTATDGADVPEVMVAKDAAMYGRSAAWTMAWSAAAKASGSRRSRRRRAGPVQLKRGAFTEEDLRLMAELGGAGGCGVGPSGGMAGAPGRKRRKARGNAWRLVQEKRQAVVAAGVEYRLAGAAAAASAEARAALAAGVEALQRVMTARLWLAGVPSMAAARVVWDALHWAGRMWVQGVLIMVAAVAVGGSAPRQRAVAAPREGMQLRPGVTPVPVRMATGVVSGRQGQKRRLCGIGGPPRRWAMVPAPVSQALGLTAGAMPAAGVASSMRLAPSALLLEGSTMGLAAAPGASVPRRGCMPRMPPPPPPPLPPAASPPPPDDGDQDGGDGQEGAEVRPVGMEAFARTAEGADRRFASYNQYALAAETNTAGCVSRRCLAGRATDAAGALREQSACAGIGAAVGYGERQRGGQLPTPAVAETAAAATKAKDAAATGAVSAGARAGGSGGCAPARSLPPAVRQYMDAQVVRLRADLEASLQREAALRQRVERLEATNDSLLAEMSNRAMEALEEGDDGALAEVELAGLEGAAAEGVEGPDDMEVEGAGAGAPARHGAGEASGSGGRRGPADGREVETEGVPDLREPAAEAEHEAAVQTVLRAAAELRVHVVEVAAAGGGGGGGSGGPAPVRPPAATSGTTQSGRMRGLEDALDPADLAEAMASAAIGQEAVTLEQGTADGLAPGPRGVVVQMPLGVDVVDRIKRERVKWLSSARVAAEEQARGPRQARHRLGRTPVQERLPVWDLGALEVAADRAEMESRLENKLTTGLWADRCISVYVARCRAAGVPCEGLTWQEGRGLRFRTVCAFLMVLADPEGIRWPGAKPSTKEVTGYCVSTTLANWLLGLEVAHLIRGFRMAARR